MSDIADEIESLLRGFLGQPASLGRKISQRDGSILWEVLFNGSKTRVKIDSYAAEDARDEGRLSEHIAHIASKVKK